MLITTRILALHQAAHLLTCLIADAPRTPFPAVAMHHRFHPFFSIARFDPVDVSLATVEQIGDLSNAQFSL